ncbi:MAG: hypothetical protein ACRDFB_04130 [Rhabdochlamydiaceae bacterium]
MLTLFKFQYASETCFFIPPKGWEIANPEILAPRVHICFLGKTSKGLAPSINLATEPVNVSLESYVEEVRKIHSADPNSRWRDLGKYKTLLGAGRLTELETPTEGGMARMVQLIVLKEGVAYVLTASAIKEEFSKYYKTFDQVLGSLQSTSNLIESYPYKKNQLKKLIEELDQKFINSGSDFNSESFQKESWKPFENKIINDFTEMGPYWQILLLKELQTSIFIQRSQ